VKLSQILAVIEKILKEFLRDKTVLFWTFAIPIFFLFIVPFMNAGRIPAEATPGLKGFVTLTMTTFLIMTAGQADLAGSVASDTKRGLYLKMASMPVKAWKEGMGRVFGILIFSLLGVVLLMFLGLAYGAEFNFKPLILLESSGFVLLIALTSTGIGLITASFVKGESAATHTGVAITLVTSFCGGMFTSYSTLPSLLQAFARFYPVSSANAAMVFLLEGEDFVGYNPLSTSQISLTAVLSVAIFLVGLTLYSKRCWKKR